jgi:hypothetical protein
MGKSPKTQDYRPVDTGSATGELTAAQRAIPLSIAPTYQGYAGQPFNENAEVYPSFLPKLADESPTGLDQSMLDAIMGISPQGDAASGYVAKGAADPNAPPAAAAKPTTTPLTPQEQAELNALNADLYFANTHNNGPGSAARLLAAAGGAGRIAELTKKSMTPEQMQIEGLRRQLAYLQAGRGQRGERGSGPGYGSSGPGGVGYGSGRTA